MRIVSSEIVGLVPASALAPGDVEYLRLEGFEPEKQILERLVAASEGERRVTDERLADLTVGRFLDVLGSDAPTPGGGAAGAIAGATGAALIAMVGRLTVGKPGFEDVDDRMRALDPGGRRRAG